MQTTAAGKCIELKEKGLLLDFQKAGYAHATTVKLYNILNGILYAEEAQLIFSDEADKCFYGTLSSIDSPEPGKNNVTGEFSFTCSDPFKYSVEEMSAEPVDGLVTIPYMGTVEAWPDRT